MITSQVTSIARLTSGWYPFILLDRKRLLRVLLMNTKEILASTLHLIFFISGAFYPEKKNLTSFAVSLYKNSVLDTSSSKILGSLMLELSYKMVRIKNLPESVWLRPMSLSSWVTSLEMFSAIFASRWTAKSSEVLSESTPLMKEFRVTKPGETKS